jgi:hypothetical protein
MQCENGYTKPGVKGILCRKAKDPKENDMRSTAHALCGHQRFCPNARCYTLLPGWEKCVLRDTAAAPETREEAAGDEMPVKKTKRAAKKKSAESAEQKGE